MELNKVAESIGAINTPTVGIAGEVRCVVTKADGTVKTDTGYQKNLILNQGLDFFGGGHGNEINGSCAIGSGNSAPTITQTKLDAFIAIASGTDTTSGYSYVDTGDGMYRTWQQKKYRFVTNVDLNINELGLVSLGSTSDSYYLTTRVLPKDSLGAPTSLGLKKGETLDVYYKLHKVIDTRDKEFVINVLEGDGGAIPYNVVVRPAMVGSNMYTYSDHFASDIRTSAAAGYNGVYLGTGALGTIQENPRLAVNRVSLETWSAYTPGSYKKKVTFDNSLATNNAAIRNMLIPTTVGAWQFRFGRVSDDAPITKTASDTLSIPVEFSWGRYEGAL